MTQARQEFSFIRLALVSMGSGLLVLVVSLPLIWAASLVHRWLALAVAIAAIVGTVAVIGLMANRYVNSVAKRVEHLRHIEQTDPPASD
jgi:hypothetical protein